MVPGSTLLQSIRGRRWLKGFTLTQGELTEAYGYLLRSLDQMARLPDMVAGSDEMWQAVAITLGPVPLYPYDPNEPMNIATKVATDLGVTITVAAGNEGQIVSGNSLNPWSVASWVIGVGATDEQGTRLLPISSRGVKGQPYDAPTVVAPGESTSPFGKLDHGHQMALEEIRQAPRGGFTMAVVGHHVFNYRKDEHDRIWVSQVNNGVVSPEAPLEDVLSLLGRSGATDTRTLHGTSLATEYVNGICQRIAREVRRLVPNLPRPERPRVIKTILEDMAEPLPNLSPWAIGKGVVTRAIAVRYLNTRLSARLKDLCQAKNA